MFWMQFRKVQHFLFIFLLLGVSKAEACPGCIPLDTFLYMALPMSCLINVYPLFLFHRLISWWRKDPKAYVQTTEKVNLTLNCLLLGYADFAALAFIQSHLPSQLRVFALISPLFLNPLVLAAIAYYAVSKCEWAEHLFKQARWAFIWPFTVAFAVAAFQGSRYVMWDLERTGGLALFLLPIVGAYFTLPAYLRPWWPFSTINHKAQLVSGLRMKPAVISVRGSICKLCGETIVDNEYVQCADCSTPMHRECWEWNGSSCVVYGCQSRQVKSRDKGRRKKPVGLRRVSSFAVAGD